MKKIVLALLALFIVSGFFFIKSDFGSGSALVINASDYETAAPSHSAVPSPDDELVWISEGGKKYHKTEDCSTMHEPKQVTVSTAEDLGYTPCKKCYEDNK